MNIRVIAVPLLLVGVLQLSGCVPGSARVSPGGTYLSTSAGAHFDQSVKMEDPEKNIAGFTLGNAFRVPEKTATIYIAAANRGLVVSDDNGVTWRTIAVPLAQTLDVVVMGNGIIAVSGRDADGQGFILRSLDAGKSWDSVLTVPIPISNGTFQILSEEVVGSVVLSLERDPFDANRLYAGSSLGTILVGEQSAKVWKTLYNLRSVTTELLDSEQTLGIQQLLPSPHRAGELLLVTVTGSLLRIRDGKQSEVRIPQFVEEQAETPFTDSLGQRKVLDVTFIPGFPQALLVATTVGPVVTRNDGQKWSELNLPIDASRAFNRAVVAVSPTNSNRLLIAINNVVYRSEDSGQTWNTFDFGLDGYLVTDILIDPSNAGQVLAILRAPNS